MAGVGIERLLNGVGGGSTWSTVRWWVVLMADGWRCGDCVSLLRSSFLRHLQTTELRTFLGRQTLGVLSHGCQIIVDRFNVTYFGQATTVNCATKSGFDSVRMGF
ncbi:hypothetical protein Y032_0388g497 [Ancylostoma ceylanicum]|uniref:Uncharacterized protein n=1 Tax=Ancylostoma ceylanicum TaxID=53326 RepID=A0A016RSF8_9BILA|nr:hypothetical protein Y032_0388g497 [Ancylostoma ceylanicum]